MNMREIARYHDIRKQIIRMCKGNPGCLTFLLEFNCPSDERYLCMLERLKIDGEQAYVLWNDCCDRNIYMVKAVLSAWADGGIPAEIINEHIFNDGLRGRPFDFDAILRRNPWRTESSGM